MRLHTILTVLIASNVAALQSKRARAALRVAEGSQVQQQSNVKSKQVAALRVTGGADVQQADQSNATTTEYVVKGSVAAAGTGALVWGARSAVSFLNRRRRAERRRARSVAVHVQKLVRQCAAAGRYVTHRGLDVTKAVSQRASTVTHYACNTTYGLAATYAARSCLLAFSLAEFNNRTTRRVCAFVTAPVRLRMKPTTARSQLLEVLRAEVRMRPSLLKDARRGRLLLDDACLERYLSAARWSLDFPDRPVFDAIEATARWRASCNAARAPDALGKPPDTLRRFFWATDVKTKRKEALLMLHARNAVDAPLSHLVRVIESGCRQSQRVCVVLDCRGAPSSALFDVAKKLQKALPVFQAHYPGRLGKVIVLAAGRPGALIWGVLSKVCDDEAKQRICFLDDLEMLEALVSVRDLERRDAVFAETSQRERDNNCHLRRDDDAHTLYL